MARLARRPLAGVVAGVVVGGAIVAVLAVRDFSPTRVVENGHGPADPEGFLAAWERKLTGTWVVRATFTRTLDDRRTLTGDIVEVQRPPDRLRKGLGSTEGRVGGRRLGCAPTEGGATECRDGGVAPPYDDEVATEMALLRGYVTGAARLYDVMRENTTCFRLRLARRILAPPYGDAARFCFDARTGALRSVEVRRDRAVDETRAVEIRADVSPADFVA
jgi:hypothetical protein